MTTRKYDAVLFDLGNTLVSYYKAADFQPVLEQCVSSIVQVMNRRGHALDIEATLARAEELNRERPDGRVWPLADRLPALVAFDEKDLPSSLIDELITAFLGPIFDTGKIDPEALPVLHRVKELGLKSAIVSNTPWGSPSEQWRRELHRWGLLEAVDETVFCVDVGWRKPAPQVFSHTLSLLNACPDRTLFVGDDARWDVEGASRAGITPVLITSSKGNGAEVQRIRRLSELPPFLTD